MEDDEYGDSTDGNTLDSVYAHAPCGFSASEDYDTLREGDWEAVRKSLLFQHYNHCTSRNPRNCRVSYS
jgi:hypothetical protein